MNESPNKRKELSIDATFAAPYCDTRIEELRKEFHLELEKCGSGIGNYWSYTPNQIKEHYAVEVELASRLLHASAAERRQLYSEVYDELYRRVPFHTQLTLKKDPATRLVTAKRQYDQLLKRYLRPDSTFLEIGPGDCALSFEVAKHVKKVYAVDVSAEITRSADVPGNFELILSDGSSVDVPPGSVDVAYSNQLMEHLHPDDALAQLSGIWRALAKGGRYVCVTPHRFNGPADVSRFFDQVAKGFHLKEYSIGELRHIFREAGFSRVFLPIKSFDAPAWPSIFLESVIGGLPYGQRKRAFKLLHPLLGRAVIAQK